MSWVGCQHLYAIMSDIRMTCMCLDVGRQQLYSMVSPLTTLPRTRMRVNESSSWIPTNIHASFHCVTPRCASSCIYMYNTHTHTCILCIYACTHTHTHTHTYAWGGCRTSSGGPVESAVRKAMRLKSSSRLFCKGCVKYS